MNIATHNFTRKTYKATIKTRGIYIYGGITKDGVSGNLMAITSKDNTHTYKQIVTLGQEPIARYKHSMSYCDSLNVLVVYGGQNEAMVKLGHSSPLLNDICILAIDTMTWSKVILGDSILSYRARHSMDVIGTRLYIFGGAQRLTDDANTALIINLKKIITQFTTESFTN